MRPRLPLACALALLAVLPATAHAGPRGVVTLQLGAEAMGAAVARQPDGRLLVGASVEPRGNARFGLARLTSRGRLDRRFARRGAATVLVGAPDGMHDLIEVLPLSDGRILLGGNVDTGSGTVGDEPGLSDGSGVVYGFARLTRAGALDAAFGGGDGVHTVGVPQGASPNMAFLLPRGGGVLFGGELVTPGGGYGCALGGDADLAPAAGWADPCWRPAGAESAGFADARLDAAGGLVAAGRGLRDGRDVLLLARLQPDGSPDAAFGDAAGGGTAIDLGAFEGAITDVSLARRPGGGWVAGASAGRSLVFAGFTADGRLDPGFGSGGLSRVDADARSVTETVTDMTEAPGGGVLAVGATEGSDRSTLLVRLDAAGRPVGGFGRGGRVNLRRRELGYFGFHTAAVVMQGAKAVVVGTGYDPATARTRQVTVLRVSAAGKLDRSFGQKKKRKKNRKRSRSRR